MRDERGVNGKGKLKFCASSATNFTVALTKVASVLTIKLSCSYTT